MAALAAASSGVAQCRVAGDAPVRDLERARTACDRAYERFALLYGSPPPAGTLEISDTVEFFAIETQIPEWKLVWPNTRRMREFAARTVAVDEELDDAVDLQWTTVLPHEIGHLMLNAEAAARLPRGQSFGRIPDWLHEGTGIWMEPPAHRSDEYAILRALRPFVPPLNEILDLTLTSSEADLRGGSVVVQTFFPCASEEACGGRPYWSRIFSVVTRQFPDGSVQIDTTFHERPPPPPSPVASNFYAYSATLVRFLYDRGGPGAMSELLDRHATGPERLRLAGLPGLPADPGRLEAEWRAWFRRWIFDE